MNDNLAGNGVIVTFDGEVETCFLANDGVFCNVINQLDSHITCHLVSSVQSGLQSGILGCANFGNILGVNATNGQHNGHC